jgi:disulfide oxidoreductase YuzD
MLIQKFCITVVHINYTDDKKTNKDIDKDVKFKYLNHSFATSPIDFKNNLNKNVLQKNLTRVNYFRTFIFSNEIIKTSLK